MISSDSLLWLLQCLPVQLIGKNLLKLINVASDKITNDESQIPKLTKVEILIFILCLKLFLNSNIAFKINQQSKQAYILNSVKYLLPG